MSFFSTNRKAFFAGLLACLLWSSNMACARYLSGHVGAFAISFWRWVFAIIPLFFFTKSIIKECYLLKKHWGYFLITGVIGIGSTNTLLYFAGHTTPLLNLGLISATGPLFIIVLSHFFLHEPISKNKIIGFIIAIIGILILITGGDMLHILSIQFSVGDLLMIGVTLTAAIYTILSTKKPKACSDIPFLFFIFIIGIISLFPFYYIEEKMLIPDYTLTEWGFLVFLGLGPSLIAYLAWNHAAKILPGSVVGMIYFSIPAISAVIAFTFLGEAAHIFHLISFLIITIGIIYSMRKNKPKI